MPALKLSNPLRRDPSRPSLKDRAAALKARAARAIGRKPADEPDAPPMIPGMLQTEGERLLSIAEAEMGRRLIEDYDDAVLDDERRQRATRHRRELRIDALEKLAGRMDPPPGPLPEPGSEAALAAFNVACGESDRLMRQTLYGYPELRRDATTFWDKRALGRALERGEIAPAEYARLYPLASEREHRIEAACIATNLGALHALAHADSHPPRGEFAACSIADLARLHDSLHRIWAHATAERDAAPYCWEDDGVRSPAGDVLDAACGEIEAISARILDEVRRRQPGNDRERDERLAVLLYDTLQDGHPPEPALLTEAVAAWGVPARSPS